MKIVYRGLESHYFNNDGDEVTELEFIQELGIPMKHTKINWRNRLLGKQYNLCYYDSTKPMINWNGIMQSSVHVVAYKKRDYKKIKHNTRYENIELMEEWRNNETG